MIPYEQTTKDCLTEMFRRVGLTYPDLEFTSQKHWYTKRAWTTKEEEGFRDWMKKLLKKRYNWPDKSIDFEVNMFLLNWGWKNSDFTMETGG